MKTSFASDNTSGVHPRLLESMRRANESPAVPAYGEDPFTADAAQEIQKLFGPDAHAHFVFNGTGANVLALSSFLRPHHCAFVAESSHLHNNECGGPERFTGAKLIALPSPDGKIRPEQVEAYLVHRGDPHRSQPRLISITQCTEYGTLYTVPEVHALADFAHAHGMVLHMDGARFSNAVAALDCHARDLGPGAGVDVLSFGGTKNGLAFGEAVVFFGHGTESAEFPYVRKQGLQLASKMRFLAAPFADFLREGIWLENARHANAMAQRLAERIQGLPNVTIPFPAQANMVFAELPRAAIEKLERDFHFYVWDEARSLVRLMCSFETKAEDVDRFADAIAAAVRRA